MSLSRPTRRELLAASAALPLSAGLPDIARAQDTALGIPFGPDLSEQGWDHMTFWGIPQTEYVAAGRNELAITAQASSSLIHRPVPAPAFDARRASWRWRVDEGVPETDLSRRGGDDRAVAMYFAFAPESVRSRAARGQADLRGLLMSGSGNLLVYVWGGGAPRGTILPNPYTRGRGVYLIQRPAATLFSQWQTENVDLAGDYRRTFGGAPGILVGLAIASDSDDVDGINRARVADLALAG